MSGTDSGIASSGGAGSDSNSGNFYQGNGGQGRKKRKKQTSADQKAMEENKRKRQSLERKIMGAGIWTDLYKTVTNYQKVEETKKQVSSYVSFSSKKKTVHINA